LRGPVDFAFDSLDERPVTAAAMRGKPTVIVFLTTSSLAAQAQVDFLVAMASHDDNRVNYAAVALDGRDGRELVELYRKTLSVPFPVAMADASTLTGGAAFGDVGAVPVTVVLDRIGRVVWRADGRVAKSEELRAVLRLPALQWTSPTSSANAPTSTSSGEAPPWQAIPVRSNTKP
jgi:hypothetical protein